MCCLYQHLERLRLDAADIAEEDIAVVVGIVAEGIASVADIVAVLGIVAASALAPVLVLVLPLSRSNNRHY